MSKVNTGLLCLIVIVLFAAPAVADNHAPVVSNVTASQRTDASRIVDIHYDLADADDDACTVFVQASGDGGVTWTVPITAVSGAISSMRSCCLVKTR